jgi:pimeloyl-ACP methyl ester carboxylesterase
MNEVRKLFPKAELLVIPGATHFVHTDKPEEFIDVVRNFLE